MKNLLRPIALAILVVFAVAACGQKGPLYLPGDPSQIRSEVPPQDPNEEDDDEDSDEDEPR